MYLDDPKETTLALQQMLDRLAIPAKVTQTCKTNRQDIPDDYLKKIGLYYPCEITIPDYIGKLEIPWLTDQWSAPLNETGQVHKQILYLRYPAQTSCKEGISDITDLPALVLAMHQMREFEKASRLLPQSNLFYSEHGLGVGIKQFTAVDENIVGKVGYIRLKFENGTAQKAAKGSWVITPEDFWFDSAKQWGMFRMANLEEVESRAVNMLSTLAAHVDAPMIRPFDPFNL